MTWKNEFADSGFADDEATILALRSDLARILRQYMARQPSQTAAAKKLGITQSMVSNIMGGRIDRISIERLIKLMVLAGISGTAQWAESADAARAVTGTWIEANPLASRKDAGELTTPVNPFSTIDEWAWWESVLNASKGKQVHSN